MVGSMVAERQIWCWKGGWDFHLWSGRQQIQSEPLRLAWASETSKLTPSDSFPPTRPHVLILSNNVTLWAYARHFHSDHLSSWRADTLTVEGAMGVAWQHIINMERLGWLCETSWHSPTSLHQSGFPHQEGFKAPPRNHVSELFQTELHPSILVSEHWRVVW